jgi:hypothetical protein
MKNLILELKTAIQKPKINLNKPIYLFLILYIAITSIYMVRYQTWLPKNQILVIATIVILLISQTKQIFHDWMPVLLIFFGYFYLQNLIPILTNNPHIYPMINIDKFIFGTIPTIQLQSLLYTSGINHWYDYLTTLLYTVHFFIPLIVALYFWKSDRRLFRNHTTAFLLLSYLGFLTYIIFPAMPPWMASNLGYLSTIYKITDRVIESLNRSVSVPAYYQLMGVNLVAAVPSLHAAYPWLNFLFVFKKNHKIGLLFLPYVIGVWFSVVYLGEHYVFDVAMGFLYASFTYLIIMLLGKYHKYNKLQI